VDCFVAVCYDEFGLLVVHADEYDECTLFALHCELGLRCELCETGGQLH